MFTLRQTAENLVILIITKYIHELYMVKKQTLALQYYRLLMFKSLNTHLATCCFKYVLIRIHQLC